MAPGKEVDESQARHRIEIGQFWRDSIITDRHEIAP
jgi:hypothetical protein